jgi:hypothetical protein
VTFFQKQKLAVKQMIRKERILLLKIQVSKKRGNQKILKSLAHAKIMDSLEEGEDENFFFLSHNPLLL